MLKEELIFGLFIFGVFAFIPTALTAFATTNEPRDSRAEIGRTIASESATISLQQLRKIQKKYNNLGKLKNLKARLRSSLNQEDQSFFKTRDGDDDQEGREVSLPEARILDGELHLVAKEGAVKIAILDLTQGKFQINNRIWKLSRPFQLKNDLIKISQILKKSYVLGVDIGENLSDVDQNALAIYGFGFLAVAEAEADAGG